MRRASRLDSLLGRAESSRTVGEPSILRWLRSAIHFGNSAGHSAWAPSCPANRLPLSRAAPMSEQNAVFCSRLLPLVNRIRSQNFRLRVGMRSCPVHYSTGTEFENT